MPSYSAPLVGMYYRPPAQSILKALPAGCILHLAPEPTNAFDPNAVQVLVDSTSIPQTSHESLEASLGGTGHSLESVLEQEKWHLGYLAKDYAAAMVGLINSAAKCSATLGFIASGKPCVHISIEN